MQLNYSKIFTKLIKILSFIDKFIIYNGKLSIFFSVILICLISVSVLMRYLFSIGFTWLQDLYIWIHATVILLGIAYTFRSDGHVRIDLFYKNSKQKFRDIINIFGVLFFTLPLSYFIYSKGFHYFLRSFQQNEASKETGGLPAIYILKFIIFLMGILLFLEALRQLFFIITIRRKKKWK